MKKIYTLFALFMGMHTLKAQTVTISDAAFASWLQFTYPTCMNGNQLDITCTDITSDTLIDISFQGISDISGIEYFTNLKQLDCSHNNLSSIPNLPQSLEILNCYNNAITSIPNLPNSLVYLDCSHNQITALPLFPNTLEALKFYDNQLTAWPTFPTLLKVLHCGGNPINSLPPIPQVLEEFDCKGLGLTTMPSLPASLTYLACEYNELSSLPTLPGGLIELHAFTNQLNSLPNLPSSLTYLNVGSNNLVSLPNLPQNLSYVNCQENALSSLPNFPNQLSYFYCRYNLLQSVPPIPNSVRVFDCSYNPIICMDFVATWNHNEPAYFYFENTEMGCRPTYTLNLEPVSLAAYMSYPVCDPNNQFGCAVLGMDENNTYSVKVFPNPSSDYIQIETTAPQSQFEIWDMSGRKIQDITLYSNATQVDISYLSSGIYYLRSKGFSTKLVKN